MKRKRIMTHYGKIKSYDTGKGAGMITPDKGGDALPFNKADLQQQAEVPKADQRYGYETRQIDGGKAHAINLQMEQGTSDSAAEQQS
jgi:cold shock protein